MAGFGHVMKIFIGSSFPRMGFLGYIVCLYVVSCDNVYFSFIIVNVAHFNLTIGIRAKRSIWFVNSQERRVPGLSGSNGRRGKV